MNLYQLDKNNPLLPLLISREVHQLEENILTPGMEKKGGKSFYDFYCGQEEDSNEQNKRLHATRAYLEKIASESSLQKAFYYTAAAHLAFISQDWNKARSLEKLASESNPAQAVKDQLHLLRLLVMANEMQVLTPASEARILPSIKWLKTMAAKDEEFAQFYRNFFCQLLAGKYQAQKNKALMALCLGAGDLHSSYSGYAIEFLRNEMDIEDVMKLHQIFNSKSPSPYQKFLIHNSVLKPKHVIDMIGTSYLRSHNFTKAVEWLQRTKENEVLTNDSWDEKQVFVDLFFDYVNDSERYDKFSKTPWTKLSLAKKMLSLERSLVLTKDREKKAGLYYQLATAYYNLSYYGNSYYALVYYRPSTDWNDGEYAAEWEKEYFGVHKAKAYYEKAYQLTQNKEFKAACYFLFIKCDQRQVYTGPYYWNETDSTFHHFKYNRYFQQFQKEFGKTKYFRYVYDRCSYLSDFVNKK